MSITDFTHSLFTNLQDYQNLEAEEMGKLGLSKLCMSFWTSLVGSGSGLASAVLEHTATCADDFQKKKAAAKVVEPCKEATARSILGGINAVVGVVKVGYLNYKLEAIKNNPSAFSDYFPLVHEMLGLVVASAGLATKILGNVEQCDKAKDEDLDANQLCKAASTKVAAKVVNICRSTLFILQKKCASTPFVFKFHPPFDFDRLFAEKTFNFNTNIEKVANKREQIEGETEEKKNPMKTESFS